MRWLLCALLLAAPARAERGAGELKQLLVVGDDAFDHGFYGDALGAYQDAYSKGKNPALLLKIGSCLEHLKRWSEAAESYHAYAAADPTLSAGERANLEAKAAALRERAHPAPVVPAAPAPVVAAAPLPASHVVGLRRAVVTSAIATVIVGVTAGAVTIGAADRYSQLNTDCRNAASGCSSDARSRLRALDHAADSLWALAAAGAITTVALHFVLRHERKLHAALAPTSGGARASLALEF